MLCRQPRRRHRRGLEEGVVVGQVEHLSVGGFGQLLAAVADIDAPQAGHRIEIFLAVGVPDPHALGVGDDPRAAFAVEGLVVGEGMKMMADVGGDDLGQVDIRVAG